MRPRHHAATLLAIAALPALLPAIAADFDWKSLLRREAIEEVEISPDGRHLALAQRGENGTVIVIRDAATLASQTMLDPGDRGEVTALRWLDDDRLLVGANRADNRFQVAFWHSTYYLIGRDGTSKYRLPGNFIATIDGDPDHLLVADCTGWKDGHCVDEVRRAEIGHLSRNGEKVIAAPDREAELWPDRHGAVRFAIAWDDSEDSKLYVHRGEQAGWTLLNDSKQSHVDVLPWGMDEDGRHAWLLAERPSGMSAVERYDMDSGERTEVYRHATSDPVYRIRSFDGDTTVGAYFDPTAPKAVLFNTDHPDAKALQQVLAAFPGKFVTVTSATRDRQRAIVHTWGDRDPGTYYLFDRAANRATVLTPARPWLDAARLPASRGIAFKARDGLALHGVLTLPPGVADPRQLPMVVLPHGGPYLVTDLLGFDEESSLLASQGFAVLRVNFRGSGGYGRDFVERGYLQWGRAMQDDVTDATRWAIEQGIADPARICLYGSSYGGYAALMGAVREPALYRCAAGFAAPYDLAKMYKWGSIRRSDLGLNYLARVIGKDQAELAARSPAKHAGDIRVPVLLAHGRVDGRVDIAHSRAMDKALRKQGVQVELVEYPNAGHGMAIEADQVDFYTRLLAFLKTHTAAR